MSWHFTTHHSVGEREMHDITSYGPPFLSLFLKIAQIERASDKKQKGLKSPSSQGQMELANMLVELMTAMGLKDVRLSDKGYLTATLPGNTGGSDTMGLLAHLDTANRNEAGTVNPQIVLYQGGDIKLDNGLVIEADKRPYLQEAIGGQIVVTDGRSLLGADDGAGIAEILIACQYLLDHPEIQRRDLRIGFFPDEELALQAEDLGLKQFAAAYAYTVDGPGSDEICAETFNGWTAHLKINGLQCFPGDAKKLGMVQTHQVLASILGKLGEVRLLPQYRDGEDSYIMPTDTEGDESVLNQDFILRAFTTPGIDSLKEALQGFCVATQAEFPGTSFELTFEFGYPNMKQYLEGFSWVVEAAWEAMVAAGLKPKMRPARGGTDGSSLSKRGLPCPDIAAGYHDQHGPLEHLVVPEAMGTILTLINLIEC